MLIAFCFYLSEEGNILEKESIKKLQIFIDEIKKNEKIDNAVIRDDVFSILEKKCTVLYFPLEDDDIDGFHIERMINGQKKDFVFINSAKKTEKQIFIAAHELGHLFKVINKIDKKELKCNENKKDFEETVVNRFAAELLMPEVIFQQKINEKLSEMDYDGKKISYTNLARLTAFLMSYFYVPLKAILIRYHEVGRIDFEAVEMLSRDKKFNELLLHMIDEGGYTRLNKIPKTKGIKDLPMLLKSAKDNDIFSKDYLKVLKDAFSIKDTEDKTNALFKGEDNGNSSDN